MSKRLKKVCKCGCSTFEIEIQEQGQNGLELVKCVACSEVVQETSLDIEIMENLAGCVAV